MEHSIKSMEKRTTKTSKFVPVPVALFLMVFLTLIAFGALPRVFQQQALFLHTKEQLSEPPSVAVTIAQPGPAIEELLCLALQKLSKTLLLCSRQRLSQ